MKNINLKSLNLKVANYHTVVIDLDYPGVQIDKVVYKLNNINQNPSELSNEKLTELRTSLENTIKEIESLMKKPKSPIEGETLEKYKEIFKLTIEKNGFLTRFQKGIWDSKSGQILPRVRLNIEFLTEKEKLNFIASLEEM